MRRFGASVDRGPEEARWTIQSGTVNVPASSSLRLIMLIFLEHPHSQSHAGAPVDVQGDPATVRDFAQTAEDMGFHHLAAPDHVLGVNVASRPDWGNRNTSKDFFHDPFVL